MKEQGNMWGGLIIGLLIGALIGWWGTVQMKSGTNLVPILSGTTTMTTKEVNLYKTMEKLWMEHVWWTREYLLDAIGNAPQTSLVAAKLLQNQVDIGNAIKPVYGNAAGEQLTSLLKTHIMGAVNLVAAAKSGNKAAFDKANTEWYANADQIAEFLATANPNWMKADLVKMMHDHLDLTKQEAIDIMGKKFEASISDFQKVEEEILKMADALSRGIVKQYPASF